ncbi:hypothetical protein BMS3Bbin04_02077 [bacterium BMS3Bbin04]|nr:hypothetical protein BMS3Bbin04_02077 [bacterium BMS3Bbin04]
MSESGADSKVNGSVESSEPVIVKKEVVFHPLE